MTKTILFICSTALISCQTVKDVFDSQWYYRGGLQHSSLSLETSVDNAEESNKQQLVPSRAFTVGIGAGNEILGVGVRASLPQSDEEIKANGQSSVLDLQAHGASGHLGYDIWFQQFKGFYLPDSETTNEDGTKKNIQFGEMYLERIGITGFWVFNSEDFKYAASFDQSAVQKQSGGSWMLFASIDRFTLQNLPTVVLDQYNQNLETNLNVSSLSFMGGYGYRKNFNYAGLWFTGVLAIGSSYQVIDGEYLFLNGQQSWGLRGSFRTSFGADLESWFTGFSLIADGQRIGRTWILYNLNSTVLELFIGFRY